MSEPTFRFCPRCATPLEPRADGGLARPACPAPGCGFVRYDNPAPVVAAILEQPEGIVLVRNQGWPEKMFGLPAGFVEAHENPAEAVVREVQEEVGVTATNLGLVGVYPFAMMNQIILAYYLKGTGPVVIGEEIAEFKIVPEARLRGWPLGTGLAVEDWLGRRAQRQSGVLLGGIAGGGGL